MSIFIDYTTHGDSELDEIGLPLYSCTERVSMPKYLIHAKYTTEGIRGLAADSASGRRADVQAAVKAVGGTVEAFYFAFGDDDVVMILDLPDNIKAAAIYLASATSGAVQMRTTPLLTVEEVDQALEIKMHYRPPGE
jgi:uncharacterized protein with GYD domain